MPRQLVALCVFGLVACGGGSDSASYQQAVDQASQLEAAARASGVSSPCTQSSQCGLLTFLEPTACPMPTYQVYSLVSASAAAASAAASEEIIVAAQAIALDPGPFGPCPAFVIVPPIPVCVANVCQPSF
jgi:hypothetical protein